MKMRPIAPILVLMLLTCAAPAAAQPAAAAAGDAGYYFLLGRRHESMGDVDKAVAAYKQALTLAPNSAELRAELAGLYARQDRAVEAIEHGRGSADEGSGQPRSEPHPRIDLRGARRAAPEAQARRRSRVCTFHGDCALERARAEGPDTPLDLTLGRLYLQTKSYDKAIALLRRVQLEQPGSTELAMMIATAEEGAGRTADAAETLREAVADNPKFFRGLIMLAELSEKQGEWDAAADAYTKAQALNPRIDLASRRAAALIKCRQGARSARPAAARRRKAGRRADGPVSLCHGLAPVG